MIPTAPFAQLLAQTAPAVTNQGTSNTGGAAVTSAPSGAPAAGTAKEPPFWANPIFLPLVLLGVFLLFSTRSKKKQDQKIEDMLSNLKKGDRVQTIGGILGTVVEARETEVTVKVDETNNTKIKFSRKAIHRVLVEDDAADKK